ncbi:unnamed protein product [Medioppia subpectinata]|uniref:Uncharacterized protein n=1 Tax=Medioppia subpectinata TaxID=1979941 RepID=A0A7R9QHK7_9ACAR|nr:unnamed protein product [Medioppia subpectinata]CAG2120833.1 unnamed protein product [Medioppia subpectinata]
MPDTDTTVPSMVSTRCAGITSLSITTAVNVTTVSPLIHSKQCWSSRISPSIQHKQSV